MDNYTQDELKNLFGSVGTSVTIHRTALFFNPKKIFIGSNVRIDAHVILSAGQEGIFIGNNIHVAPATHFYGSGGKITLEDFSSISSRVSFFSSSDDYKEGFLTNPTLPMTLRKVTTGPVTIGKYVVIGCGAVIMPNVTLGEGAAVGALSFVKQTVAPYEIVAGIPAVKIGDRTPQCETLAQSFASTLN